MGEDAYTTAQAARALGTTRWRVRGMLEKGTLRGARDQKGRWKIPASALREILAGPPEQIEGAMRAARGPKETGRAPTSEEFAGAKRRELARLNLRLSRLTGHEFLAPEDRAVLEGDTPRLEARDRETVRRWCEAGEATPSDVGA